MMKELCVGNLLLLYHFHTAHLLTVIIAMAEKLVGRPLTPLLGIPNCALQKGQSCYLKEFLNEVLQELSADCMAK